MEKATLEGNREDILTKAFIVKINLKMNTLINLKRAILKDLKEEFDRDKKDFGSWKNVDSIHKVFCDINILEVVNCLGIQKIFNYPKEDKEFKDVIKYFKVSMENIENENKKRT
jgi:hypothetical protein